MRAHAIRNLLALGLLFLPPALAQEVQVSETSLAFRFPRTESQQRSFRVEPKDPQAALPKLQTAVMGDLVEAGTGFVILARNVTVASAERNEEQRFETFTVTVSNTTRAGSYAGRLKAQPQGGAAVTIDLAVTVLPVSQVDAEANSKSPVLLARQGWLDLPFSGEPAAKPEPSHRLSLDFVQTGGGEASVDEARVLSLIGPGSRRLPHECVSVTSMPPLVVAGKDARPLEIGVAAQDLDPGEYKGTLDVHAVNQEVRIQIPLTVKIKHGPLLPLIVLMLGILAAFLFTWWNSEGKAARDLVKVLESLDATVAEGRKLQAEDRKEADRLLAEAWKAIESRAPAADAKARADTAQAYVGERQAAADRLLSETLKPLREKVETKIEGHAPGARLRQGYLSELDAVESGVQAGRYTRLREAEDRLHELSPRIDLFARIMAKLQEVKPEKRSEIVQKMDQADTLAALRQVLVDEGVQDVPNLPPGMSFDVAAGRAPVSSTPERRRRKLQLALGATAVAAVTYLFVLIVGWISLYLKNDTFGADPMSYVSLFLWGATVEAVRGKAVSLTSLRALTEQK
jgi:hypothetical protein